MRNSSGQINQTELLAPGGSMESIRAAINAGADAVYAAGTRFGARAYADNPQPDQLLEAIDLCHVHGVKLYLTVNTLMKEKELERELPDFLRPYYERGVDAVLVQDLGTAQMIRACFPDLPLHASTQMSVQSVDGARLAAALGITRIVSARELSLAEIRKIRRETGMEIECFIHGALCFSYSGQCLMSSLIGGRSGNRGRCAQPCRKKYTLTEADGRTVYADAGKPEMPRQEETAGKMGILRNGETTGKKGILHNGDTTGKKGMSGQKAWYGRGGVSGKRDGYILSLKDIAALDLIPDLIEAGIASFKIEGRMKSDLYTAGVTSIYRKYIDLYRQEGREGFRVEPSDRERLYALFQKRGYTKGYYFAGNSPKMMAEDAEPGAKQIRRELPEEEIRERYLTKEKQEKIKGLFILKEGQEAILEVSVHEGPPDGSGLRFRAEGQAAVRALNRAVTAEQIERQLRKTGDTPFAFEDLRIDMEDDLFIPMGAVNTLRREALQGLKQVILQKDRRQGERQLTKSCRGNDPGDGRAGAPCVERTAGKPAKPQLTALVSRPDQLEAVLQYPSVRRVYLDCTAFMDEAFCAAARPGAGLPAADLKRRHIRSVIARVKETGRECCLALPRIWRLQARERFDALFPEEILRLADGLLLRCQDQIGAFAGNLSEKGERPCRIMSDENIYAWNRRAVQTLAGFGIRQVTLPAELAQNELAGLAAACPAEISFELPIYGYQVSMITAQCLRKNAKGCDRTPSLMMLRDERHACFPVKNRCGICTNEIYNSAVLDLTDLTNSPDKAAPGGASHLRLSFTIEDEALTRAVLNQVTGGRPGRKPAAGKGTGIIPQGSFTRGHFRRGVE